MNQTIKAAAVTLNLLGLVLLVYALSGAAEDPPAVEPPAAATGFASLERGQPQHVDLGDARVSSPDWKSRADYSEQVRDWLLYLVVSAASADANQVAEVLHATSPVRRSYASPSVDFQHGSIRSAFLDHGTVVALMPRGQSPAERIDAVAAVADRHSMEQGYRIERLWLVEYCISWPQFDETLWQSLNLFGVGTIPETLLPDAATLELVDRLDRGRLFSPEFGWVEQPISNVADLERFLEATDDLIAMVYDPASDRVLAGGRKYRKRSFGQLTAEHVATLHQAYRRMEAASTREGQRRQKLVRDWMLRRLDNLAAEQDLPDELVDFMRDLVTRGRASVTAGLSSEADQLQEIVESWSEQFGEVLEQLDRQWGNCDWENLLLATKRGLARGTGDPELHRLVLDYYTHRSSIDEPERSLLRGGIGFSLDSDYDFAILEQRFDHYLRTGNRGIVQALQPLAGEIRANFARSDANLLLCLIEAANETGNREIARQINSELLDPASYQVARYDGGIAGTEVGQILFITDLLAKLLDMDFDRVFDAYFGDAQQVEWSPTIYAALPVAYMKQQEQLPGTRIWFGIRDDAFRPLEDESGLLFAPTAARVYALSRGAVAKEKETQPTYLSARFVEWFNNHYGRVASVERRYDQLNQLVKWSAAMSGPAAGYIAGLEDHPVRRDLWFPDWVREQPDEPYATSWRNCFYARGKYRDDVETLFVLHANWTWRRNDGEEVEPDPDRWCGGSVDELSQQWSIRGGVTLPNLRRRAALRGADRADRAALGERPRLRRPNVRTARDSENGLRTELNLTEEYSARKSFVVQRSEDGASAHTRHSVQAVRREGNEWVEEERLVYHRGRTAEVSPRTFEDSLSFDGRTGTVAVESRLGADGLARTTFGTQPGRLHVEQELLAHDIGSGLALRLVRMPVQTWSEFLAGQPTVRKVLEVRSGSVFAQLESSGQWIEFAYEARPSLNIGEGFTQRVSSARSTFETLLDTSPPPVNVRVAAESDVLARIASADHLTARYRLGDTGALSLDIRGPPGPPRGPAGRPVRFGSPEGPRRGFLDSERGEFRVDPRRFESADELRSFLSAVEDPAIRNRAVAQSPGRTVVLPIPERPQRVEPSEINALQSSRSGLLHEGLGSGTSALREGLAENRQSFLDMIERARGAGQHSLADRLVREFTATYRPTPAEAFRFAYQKIRRLPVASNPKLEGIDYRNPEALTNELAALTRQSAVEGNLQEARNLLKIGQYGSILAKSLRTGDPVRFGLRETDGSLRISAAIQANVDRQVAATAESLERAHLLYVDQRILRQGWPPGRGIEVDFPEAVLFTIRDPQRLIRSAGRDSWVDDFVLGGMGTFRRVPEATPEVRPDVPAATYRAFLEEVAGPAFTGSVLSTDAIPRPAGSVPEPAAGADPGGEEVYFLTLESSLSSPCLSAAGDAEQSDEGAAESPGDGS